MSEEPGLDRLETTVRHHKIEVLRLKEPLLAIDEGLEMELAVGVNEATRDRPHNASASGVHHAQEVEEIVLRNERRKKLLHERPNGGLSGMTAVLTRPGYHLNGVPVAHGQYHLQELRREEHVQRRVIQTAIRRVVSHGGCFNAPDTAKRR